MAKWVIWDFLPDGSAPPKSITTSVHRKHTTQISTVYKQCVHCRIYFPSLYFLYVEKKIERKITFDASKTAGRPNFSGVPCERQHKEKKKKTNITMSRHRKKIPPFLSSFLFDAIYRSNSMIGLMMSKKINENGCDDKQEKKHGVIFSR